MRLQYFPETRVHIEDRSENGIDLTIEEAEDLYFGLGFILRDLKEIIEEEEE